MEMELWRLDHRMDYVGQIFLLGHVARIWPDMTTDRKWNYGGFDHRMDHVGRVPLPVHVAHIWPDMTTDRWILE